MSFLWLALLPVLSLSLAYSFSTSLSLSLSFTISIYSLLLLCWYFVNLMAPRDIQRHRVNASVSLAFSSLLPISLLSLSLSLSRSAWPVLLISSCCVLCPPCSLSCSRSGREFIIWPTAAKGSNRIKDKQFMCVRASSLL